MTPPPLRKARPWSVDDHGSEPRPSAPEADRSLEALYRDEASRLAKTAARHLPARDEARDVVQDAFLRLLRISKHTAGAVERPGAYLNRIVRNILVDRAENRGREVAHRQAALEQDSGHAIDPHGMLESRDRLRRLDAALEKLKPKTRAIFLAHRIEGLSYADIAQRTGLSVKGVEKHMGKALAHLDRVIERI